jgi:4-hydroxy-3-methylbut-2-enyl diphosphate reductase
MEGLASVGVTAGASAPEKLVEEVIGAFKERFEVALEVVTTATEHIAFNVPRELRAAPVG